MLGEKKHHQLFEQDNNKLVIHLDSLQLVTSVTMTVYRMCKGLIINRNGFRWKFSTLLRCDRTLFKCSIILLQGSSIQADLGE